jgi:hypothetical protein
VATQPAEHALLLEGTAIRLHNRCSRLPGMSYADILILRVKTREGFASQLGKRVHEAAR